MATNNHLVIIGDSMCMPRDFDGIPLEATYPYMLAKDFPEYMFFNRAVRANTFVRQMEEMQIHDDITCFNPKVMIVNIGMADCAPRLFSLNQGKILKTLPNRLSKPIVKVYSKNRLFFTKRFPKVYVSIDVFKEKTAVLFKLAVERNIKLIVVGIAPVSKELMERSFGFERNILAYNDILKHNLGNNGVFIDTYNLLEADTDLLPDGFHLTIVGNAKMYEEIRGELKKMGSANY